MATTRAVLVGLNDVPEGSSPFCIRECWGEHVYRGPFDTRQEAGFRALAIAEAEGYEVSIYQVAFNVAGPTILTGADGP